MQIWLGTSGYSYSDWVGSFYPPGTKAGRMLHEYCRHFPLVELNFTFYRLPTPAMLVRLADQAPAAFQFVVKLPRTLSHDASPDDLPAFRDAVDALRERGQLAGLLCQLPQATHQGPKVRAWLEYLGRELAGRQLAVEFRHHSWARADVPEWLRQHGIDLVAVDVPPIPALYPAGLVQPGPRVYVRLHSRNAINWYKSDKERYDYDYDDAALMGWIDALRGAADGTERVLLLFNNCHRSQAADNARRMHELMGRLLPEHDVVPPFAAPETEGRQRLLFE
jgi:uncharacterized protein YecE (DUF72 family)